MNNEWIATLEASAGVENDVEAASSEVDAGSGTAGEGLSSPGHGTRKFIRDRKKAAEYFQMAADGSFAPALNGLGMQYLHGVNGFEHNPHKAVPRCPLCTENARFLQTVAHQHSRVGPLDSWASKTPPPVTLMSWFLPCTT